MKAVVYHRPKKVSVDEVPEPRIEHPRDAIVRVTSTAICGSDLHIFNGLLPQIRDMIVGHEFMGVVEEVGDEVANLQPGDRVVVPFPIADGTCWFCARGLPTQCENSNPRYGPEGGLLTQKGAGIFGYTDLYGGYAGGQAEYVRVPYADYGPRKVPSHLRDEEALFLTDIFPTGWTAIDWAARLLDPARGDLRGQSVAILGSGPVGLMAQKAARLRGAERVIAVDVLDYRLDMASTAGGADAIVNADDEDPAEAIRALTGGRGADAVVDAVGMEAERNVFEKASAALHLQRGTLKVFRHAMDAVRRGGAVSVVGVYGTPYDNFPWGQVFDKGVKLAAGQAPVHDYIDDLMNLVADRRVRLDDIITHTLPLDEAPYGYEIFNGKRDGCVKVVLKP